MNCYPCVRNGPGVGEPVDHLDAGERGFAGAAREIFRILDHHRRPDRQPVADAAIRISGEVRVHRFATPHRKGVGAAELTALAVDEGQGYGTGRSVSGGGLSTTLSRATWTPLTTPKMAK